MITINPTIQERAFNAANEYWHLILRVKELRIRYGLQNPKNNKPLVQTYNNTITAHRPNINQGWNNTDDGLTLNLEYDGTGTGRSSAIIGLLIKDNTIFIERLKPFYEVIPVFAAPADLKTKAKKEKFLKAVGYTLISDPCNLQEYLPKVEFSRFNIPALYMAAYEPEGVPV